MKANVLGLDGNVVEEIELPATFEEEYRPDIIRKAVHSLWSHKRQAYGVSPQAAMDYSVENWGPGRGSARVPRVKDGRRAARVPQAVKGRQAHPPKVEKKWDEKINKKEKRKALKSAISATAIPELVSNRNHLFEGDLPKIVVDDAHSITKSKEVLDLFETLGISSDVLRAKKRKRVRAGKGKRRGRKYIRKKSVLLVVGEDNGILKASKNLPGVDAVNVKDLNVDLLAPGASPGRLTLWTKSAVNYLEDWL